MESIKQAIGKDIGIRINPAVPGDYSEADTFVLGVRDEPNIVTYAFMTSVATDRETIGKHFLPVASVDLDRFHQYLVQRMKASDAHKVKEFTEGSTGQAVPTAPVPMTRAQVEFLVKMMASELVELAQTVTDNHEEARKMVADAASTDAKPDYKRPTDPIELAAHQADAIVDAWYYGLNGAAKCGMNLSALFGTVHAANMAKRDATGKFVRDERGKVIKPANWREPDIIGEIARQAREGAW